MASAVATEQPVYRPFASRDPSLLWPALPRGRDAVLAGLLQQLEESQWWPPAQLLRQQLRQARLLLQHAYHQVPFHRARLQRAGFVPGRPLTPALWDRIPVLTRAEVQQAGTALHAASIPSGHGATTEISSSGSTGQVVTVRTTRLTQIFWDALNLRDHLWHRRDLTRRLAAIRPYPAGVADYPDGGAGPHWGRATRSLFANGPAFSLTISSPVEQQAEWLRRVNPDYLLTYPSALRDLLVHCRARGIAVPGLRGVRTLSETLPPETRDLCREVWGVPVADGYSSQENGVLALQCPAAEHYHVQSEAVILEVVNEAGAACRPGEVGEVVVTSLHNFAMPMIRYALGDMAEVGAPCPCGRGLPVLNRVLGRVRDRLAYPDGRQGWPMMGDIFHAGVPGIRQYQILQHGLDDVELKLAVDRPLGPEDEDKLRRWLHLRSGHPFPLRFSYEPEIRRGPGGKFETFRNLMPEHPGGTQGD
jgi:phenylacetate-CoA ligase